MLTDVFLLAKKTEIANTVGSINGGRWVKHSPTRSGSEESSRNETV